VTLRTADTVVIVEDEKSVLAATRYHIPAIAAPANQWKTDWSAMLGGIGQIIIVADKDDAGRASADKIKRTLNRARVVEAPEGKDLFDYHEYLHRHVEDITAMRPAMERWLGI